MPLLFWQDDLTTRDIVYLGRIEAKRSLFGRTTFNPGAGHAGKFVAGFRSPSDFSTNPNKYLFFSLQKQDMLLS